MDDKARPHGCPLYRGYTPFEHAGKIRDTTQLFTQTNLPTSVVRLYKLYNVPYNAVLYYYDK